MRISLCLMVWNELEGCRSDVPLLPREAFDEIYAIDGGSSDGTVPYLESQNIPVYPQAEKGLNAAYIHAVEKSTCDAVVVFLPKGTTPPEDTSQVATWWSPVEILRGLGMRRTKEYSDLGNGEFLFCRFLWHVYGNERATGFGMFCTASKASLSRGSGE
jgi:glycosyltransferase involved in cell wall biosynthesis